MGFTGSPIPNGDFETGDLTDWTTSGVGTTPVVTTVDAHGGTHSLLLGSITDSGTSGDSIAQQAITVPSSGRPILSVWFKAHVDPAGDGEFDVIIYPSSGESNVISVSKGVDSGWHNVTADLTAWLGQSVTVTLDLYQDGAAVNYAFVDDIAVGVYTAPANDNFANATVLAGHSGQLKWESNTLATVEAGEPPPSTWTGLSPPTGTRTVWYKWTAPQSGYVEFSTRGSLIPNESDSFDTVIDVWTGSAVGALTLVAANDDCRFTDVMLGDRGYGIFDSGPYTSYVKFACTASTVYYLRVYGFGTTDDTDKLAISWDDSVTVSTSPPPNDDFANATPISLPGTVLVQGTFVGATQESGEPFPRTSGGTVWYVIDQPIDFSLVYLLFEQPLQIFIYQGTSFGDLVELAEVYPHGWVPGGRWNFLPTSGDPIYLQVAMQDGSTTNPSTTGGVATDFRFWISQAAPAGGPPSFPAVTGGAVLMTDPLYTDPLSFARQVTWLRSNRFVVVVNGIDGSNLGTSTLALHDGAGHLIDSLLISTSTNRNPPCDGYQLCRLDDTHLLVALHTVPGDMTLNHLRAVIVTIGVDDSIILGSLSGQLDSGNSVLYGNGQFQGALALSPTEALLAWMDTVSPFAQLVALLSISGTSVTVLDQKPTGGIQSSLGIIPINATTAALFTDYRLLVTPSGGGSYYIYAYAIAYATVSGGALAVTSATPVVVDEPDTGGNTAGWSAANSMNAQQVIAELAPDMANIRNEMWVRFMDWSSQTAGPVSLLMSFLPIFTGRADPANNLAADYAVNRTWTIPHPADASRGLIIASINYVWQDMIDTWDDTTDVLIWEYQLTGTGSATAVTVTSGPTALGIPTTGYSLITPDDFFNDSVDPSAFALDPGNSKALLLIERDITTYEVLPGQTRYTTNYPVKYGFVPYQFSVPRNTGTAAGARTRSGSATGQVLSPPTSPPATSPPTPPTPGLGRPAPWTFVDLSTYEQGIFALNPAGGGEPLYEHQVAFSLIFDSGPTLTISQDQIPTGQFTIDVLNQTDWDFFTHWFNKDEPILLTDDLGRELVIVFADFTFDRQRKANTEWFHALTAQFRVLAAQDI